MEAKISAAGMLRTLKKHTSKPAYTPHYLDITFFLVAF